MKRWVLDATDCVESPLLAESKRRHKWDKRSWMDLYVVRYGELRSRSSPQLTGLTEKFFTGDASNVPIPAAWYEEGYLDLSHLNRSGVLGMMLR
jgi:hypothetical protein